jgi:glyoxalase family protein
MTPILAGIHHVTMIASDPKANLDFYTGTLGLRLVKLTVNFDSPTVYHLYYGDGLGSPGTILTFFPFPHARRGRQGTGQVAVTALAIAPASLGYWIERLLARGVAYDGPTRRGDEQVLALRDPDGLMLELVTDPSIPLQAAWERGPVPAAHQIRSVHSVQLWVEDAGPTAELLTGPLGFERVAELEDRVRFRTPAGTGTADVRGVGGFPRGNGAAGTVHHVAWRTPDDAQQAAWLELLTARGLDVTPVRDRQYFRSIYFREPGGVLYEIATDSPGFTVDESPEELGSSLKLPPWFEPRRQMIEESLPVVRLPEVGIRDTG